MRKLGNNVWILFKTKIIAVNMQISKHFTKSTFNIKFSKF